MNQISKKKSIALIIIIIILLIGICFATLAVYAKREFNKPKFRIPEEEPVSSMTELPEGKEALVAYVNSLYEKALKADTAEGSWHTDVNFGGDIITPFAQADQSILTYIKDNAGGEIASLYPNESEVKMSQAEIAPSVAINAADVTEFTAEQGHTDDNGNVSDDGFYFIRFVIEPKSVDTGAFSESSVYTEAVKKLSEIADITESEFEAEELSYSFKINRITDEISNVDISGKYKIKSILQLKPDFAGLLPAEQDSMIASVELPYNTDQHISFKWYGCRFTQRSMAVKPSDMKALPADIRVNSEATKDDFKLTFTPSVQDAVSIDADGVMTVSKNAVQVLAGSDEPVIINMKLDYEGKTYSDDLIVYITELEVETDV